MRHVGLVDLLSDYHLWKLCPQSHKVTIYEQPDATLREFPSSLTENGWSIKPQGRTHIGRTLSYHLPERDFHVSPCR